jgi:hypothetical protein
VTRGRVLTLLGAALLAVIVVYVATHTEWTDLTIPMPPTGEARRKPFYAVQRFAEALDAHSAWDRAFAAPPPGAVVVISSWHWSLSSRRREALERWVESGGRLVVDRLLLGDDDAFSAWSGIDRVFPEVKLDEPDESNQNFPADSDAAKADSADEPRSPGMRPCRTAVEQSADADVSGRTGGSYLLCGFDRGSWLTVRRPTRWALRVDSGLLAARVPVGRGSVTVLNGTPFREMQLFRGDHAALFIAATQLKRGDQVRFLSEDDHPSLLALAWQHGGPAVVLGLALLVVALWRNASRAGPLELPPERARRSLAEQIRGTGRFIVGQGNGEPLHAATVRALQTTVERRVPGYARLHPDQQLAVLAEATGISRESLAAAIHHGARRHPHELRATIMLIEEARRCVRTGHLRRTARRVPLDRDSPGASGGASVHG